MLFGFENQIAISSWKLEGLMLFFLFEWIMEFTKQTRTHTARPVPLEKIEQVVCIQSDSTDHLSDIEYVDTIKQHIERDILMLHCLVRAS